MAFLTALPKARLFAAWVVGSIAVSFGHIIVLLLLDLSTDPLQAAVAGVAILLPLTLIFSLPFMLLLALAMATILRGRLSSPAFLRKTALISSLGAAAGFGALALVQDNGWNVFATAALATPIYGGLSACFLIHRTVQPKAGPASSRSPGGRPSA